MDGTLNWHARFVQQAGWTGNLRKYLYAQAEIKKAGHLLEVGCGTGVILAELIGGTNAAVHGLDLDRIRLKEAALHAPKTELVCGNGLALPYPEHVFDTTLCHFLLLWVKDPVQVLREMKRVTISGGNILVMAEPDYSKRVDKPDDLADLGRWQTEALQRQGADPQTGNRLGELFEKAGILLIESGRLRGFDASPPTTRERELEWAVLEDDLEGRVTASEMERLKALDARAWKMGERILYVPTYYARGKA